MSNANISKKAHRINLVVLVLLVTLVASFCYLWYSNELQFIASKTKHTHAVITETNMFVWSRAYGGGVVYKQSVWYKFEDNEKTYSGSFVAGKSLGKFSVGDSILVKFALQNPSKCKFIARLD